MLIKHDLMVQYIYDYFTDRERENEREKKKKKSDYFNHVYSFDQFNLIYKSILLLLTLLQILRLVVAISVHLDRTSQKRENKRKFFFLETKKWCDFIFVSRIKLFEQSTNKREKERNKIILKKNVYLHANFVTSKIYILFYFNVQTTTNSNSSITMSRRDS